MSETRAYRCFVDARRYAIIYATNLLEVQEAFNAKFPDRTYTAATCLPWLDGKAPPGSVEICERLFDLRINNT